MALTDHSDVFGAVHEDGLNLIGRHLMRQRPSLFNYGTQIFARNPKLLCRRIDAHPEVLRRGNPLISVEDPLPILGTNGLWGVNFCFQVTQLQLDLHPGNQFELPAELGPPLGSQRLALLSEVCGSIACPNRDIADQVGDTLADLPTADREERDSQKPPTQPIPAQEIQCFCLKLFAVAYVELVGSSGSEKLAIRLENLEIVDIRPEELENNLECYVATTLRVGILPRVRIALDTLVYKLGTYATLSISPTPISADVPHNPAIEDDQIKVFVNVGVS